MADGIIEKLLISVGLDTNAVDKGMNALESTMSSGFRNIMSSVVAPALSMLGAFSAGDFVAQIGQEAMAIQKYAQLLGMSTEQMSAWASVADNFGIEAGDLVDVLTDVNDKVTDLVNNDAGPFKELVDRGLITSFKNADGTLKSTEEIVYELSNAVKSLGGQQGAGLLKRLGFNDPKMLSMMMQGGDALKTLVEQMKQRGVYTDADAKSAKEFTLALKDMSRSLKMLLLPVFRLLSPIMAKTAQGFAYIADHATALIPALIAVAAVMTARMIPAAIKTAKELRAAFSIRQFGILAALIAIGLVLEDFITWLQGGESAFGDFYNSLFGGIEGAKQFINQFMQFAQVAGIVAGVAAGFVLLSQAITAAQAIMTALGVASLGTFGIIVAAIGGVIAAAWALYENWDEVTNSAATAWQTFTGIVEDAWNSVTSTIDSWINGFIATFSGIWEKIQAVREWAGFVSGSDAYITAASGGASTSTVNNNTRNAKYIFNGPDQIGQYKDVAAFNGDDKFGVENY